MKILVLSDIHANPWALEAVLEKEKTYDEVLCAGDLVDYGTGPSRVLRWMRGEGGPDAGKIVVQGNHDAHTARIWRGGGYHHTPPELYKWVHYCCRHMERDEIEYLEALPLTASFCADGWSYLIKHSYHGGYDVIESSYAFDQYWEKYAPPGLQRVPRRRLIFGHTHRQCIHILGEGMEWMNPGSLSYRRPDDPDKAAHYLVIEDGKARLGRVDYDRGPLLEEALRLHREHGMMETELQDFMFFFGDAASAREPLPATEGQI